MFVSAMPTNIGSAVSFKELEQVLLAEAVPATFGNDHDIKQRQVCRLAARRQPLHHTILRQPIDGLHQIESNNSGCMVS